MSPLLSFTASYEAAQAIKDRSSAARRAFVDQICLVADKLLLVENWQAFPHSLDPKWKYTT